MAAIPPNWKSKHQRATTVPGRRNTVSANPEALYLKKKGNYSTVLLYNFPSNTPYYSAAVVAQDKYFKIKWFEPTYFKLLRAAVFSSLEFDRHTGDLVLRVPRRTLTGLVKDVVINQLKSEVEGRAMTFVFGRVAGAYLGLLGQLLAIKKSIENRRLLSSGSKQKLFRERLKLVAAMTAKGMGGNVWQKQLQLLQNYDTYEAARNEYVGYIRKDLIRAGHHFTTYPTISARP